MMPAEITSINSDNAIALTKHSREMFHDDRSSLMRIEREIGKTELEIRLTSSRGTGESETFNLFGNDVTHGEMRCVRNYFNANGFRAWLDKVVIGNSNTCSRALCVSWDSRRENG